MNVFPFCPVLGYLKLMFLMSTDAFVSSILITIRSRNKTTGHHPPFALTRLLTTPAVTKLLALPKLEHCTVDRGRQTMDESQAEGEEGQPQATTLWDVVVVAFERIAFVTYFAITVVIVTSAFT